MQGTNSSNYWQKEKRQKESIFLEIQCCRFFKMFILCKILIQLYIIQIKI